MLCQYCGKRISDDSREDALYCSPSHRVQGCVVRRKVKQLFGKGWFYDENNQKIKEKFVKFMLKKKSEKGKSLAQSIKDRKKLVSMDFGEYGKLSVKFCVNEFKQKVLICVK